MLLTELAISRFPRTTADVVDSDNGADYANRLERLKSRSGITDERLNDLVDDQELALDDEEPLPQDDEAGIDDMDSGYTDEEPLPDEEIPAEPEDPNKMGLLRVVPRAHLVYKRAMPDGTYSEMWAYKSEDVKKAMEVRNNILSGTDIEKTKLRSDDNTQTYDVWSVGNIELMSITGLPN